MIYILRSRFEDQANWYDDFSDNLYKGLLELKEDVVMLGNPNYYIPRMTQNDYLFVTHYKHLDTIAENFELYQTKAKIIFHHHGSGVSPYTHWIDKKAEMYNIQNTIDIHTFCMPTQEKLVKEKYPCIQRSKTIGFPLDFKKYEQYKKPKKKKIVIAGHIGPERQFYLATYLLKDLLSEYEIVFSIVEKNDCVTGKWTTFYDLQRFIDMGYRFVMHSDKEGFYNELGDASHIFTCSLGDTFSVSIVEGILCGCIPVVPSIEEFWPQFMDYIYWGYNPFSKDDVERSIKNDGLPTIDLDWFKPKLVAERLLRILEISNGL